MLRPTPGELLALTRRELTEQVLPQLPPGAATRQLRAALHVLAQLERSWDLMPAYLVADNEDLRATLAELARLTGIASAPRPSMDAPVPGIHDATLAALVRDNDALQADLDEVQQSWRASTDDRALVNQVLLDLHLRMTERARLAAGLPGSMESDD